MIVELGGRIEVCIYKLLTVFCDHSNPHDLSVIATFAFACFKFTESVIFFVEERAKFFQQPYVSCMMLVNGIEKTFTIINHYMQNNADDPFE